MAKKKVRTKNAEGTKTDKELEHHRMQPRGLDDLPDPSLQPGSLPTEGPQRFSTTEIFWFNNGIWGDAGYAIPNDGGKPTTKNSILWGIHHFLGRELFKMMHSPDVKFSRPPNGNWLHKVAKMIRLCRKRMNDRSVGWNDEREGDAERVTANIKEYVYYPVPFFGGRIRNSDAREWCEIILILLSEIMQHSDNMYDGDITDMLAGEIDQQMHRIERQLATKFLGFSKEAVDDPSFVLPMIIDDTNYSPDNLFTESEMIDELPPPDWWPSANDLSPIQRIPATVATAYGMRWSISGEAFWGDQGQHEQVFPGGSTGTGRVLRPASKEAGG